MSVVEVAAPVVAPAQTDVEQRASLLEAAALEIEVRGWTQGLYQDIDGAVCLAGAVGCAVGIDPRQVGCAGVLHRVYGGHFETAVDLMEWNDVSPDRTADQVTFLLRWRAAELRDQA